MELPLHSCSGWCLRVRHYYHSQPFVHLNELFRCNGVKHICRSYVKIRIHSHSSQWGTLQESIRLPIGRVNNGHVVRFGIPLGNGPIPFFNPPTEGPGFLRRRGGVFKGRFCRGNCVTCVGTLIFFS